MTDVDPRLRRHAPRRRRRFVVPVLAIVAGLMLFAIGIAFGMALQDRPEPGGTQTFVRTLEPLPQPRPNRRR